MMQLVKILGLSGPWRQRVLRRQVKDKDILSLSEACIYLSIDEGTLLEEVSLGKLPGGKLGDRWCFCKEALKNHFSIYHGVGPFYDEELDLDWFTKEEDCGSDLEPL